MITSEELKKIEQLTKSSNIVLFMKGSKDFPHCGFSSRVVHILNTLEVDFQDIDVLESDMIRQGIKEYANWPTIPQLYIKGEFIGGCDIIVEMYKTGELEALLKKHNIQHQPSHQAH